MEIMRLTESYDGVDEVGKYVIFEFSISVGGKYLAFSLKAESVAAVS